jgi:tripartite-type tricarboxylate transporter receptor subunit TctC
MRHRLRRRSRALVALLIVLTIAVLTIAGCGTRTASQGGSSGAGQSRGPSVEEFYRGKTISVIVGLAPGGGYDTVARLVARHISKHIPGNPSVIVENMEGAGSLIAANHVYNVAKPDGLTIGAINELQVINQLTSVDGVQFDARKYGWLGNVQQNSLVCTIRSDTPYKVGRDLLRKDLPPLNIGATGPGADTYDFPKALIGALGANMRVVTGYQGTAPIRLAVEGNEVEGLCWAFESVIATAQSWLDTGFATAIVYQAAMPDPRVEQRFPGIQRAEDLASDEPAKRLIRAATAPGAISKPWMLPPATPKDRVEALQKAFAETMNDPAFKADAEQAKVDVNPNTAAETERIVNEILDLPPDLAARLAEIRK